MKTGLILKRILFFIVFGTIFSLGANVNPYASSNTRDYTIVKK